MARSTRLIPHMPPLCLTGLPERVQESFCQHAGDIDAASGNGAKARIASSIGGVAPPPAGSLVDC